MSKSVGAKVKTAVPSFFLIDRHGRVRFYRSGCSFWAATVRYRPVGAEVVRENAPEGQRIRDYVLKLLDEE